jgi:twitching motility protein PilT
VKCVDKILRQIAESNGEAVLLRASQVPLMMTGTTQSPMSMAPLSVDEMAEILTEIVPLSVRARLRDSGSVDYTVPQASDRPELSITAIGNGDDIWLEVRPQFTVKPEAAPEPTAAQTTASEAPTAPASRPAASEPVGRPRPQAPEPVAAPRRRISSCDDVNALIMRLAGQSDSSLFLHSGMPPAVKTDGAVEWLDDVEPLDADDLGRILIELSKEMVAPGGAEGDDTMSWTIPDVALVECRATLAASSVQITIRIKSTRPPDAARMAIPAGVIAACRDEYGLVTMTGVTPEQVARTCHGVIDLINRECPHHVIVLERQAVTRHLRGAAFLSHRVVTGGDEAWVAALTAALAESPDVLVTQHVPSWEMLDRLLTHAADTLVILQLEAPSVVTALKKLVAFAPAGQHSEALVRLADVLAAALAQCEVKPRGAGGMSAYEVMLPTPGVRDLLRQGAFDQLALTLERGIDGMIPMSAAIAELGRSGRIADRQARLAAPIAAAAARSRRVDSREQPGRADTRRDLSLVAGGPSA